MLCMVIMVIMKSLNIMVTGFKGLALPLLFSLFASSALATTYYVNPKFGNDSFGGLQTSQPFLSVNKACAMVHPGDTVILAQGTYFENVHLWTLGTPSQPITFKGVSRVRNSTIITGANRAFRTNTVAWSL